MPGQNVYDDEAFFSGYQQLRRTGSGYNEALEQPALRALIPDVDGADVLDLGCGDGALSRQLDGAGARSVLAIDPSARMLDLARSRTPGTRGSLQFRQAFAEDVTLPAGSVDLVVSSLALHYIADLPGMLARIATWLRPGGVLVASLEHPAVTASGGRTCDHGSVLTDYAEEGVRRTTWFVEDVIKYHRTTGTIVSGILDAGLVLSALVEPSPTAAAVHDRPDLALHRQRPSLLVVRAQRPVDPTGLPGTLAPSSDVSPR